MTTAEDQGHKTKRTTVGDPILKKIPFGFLDSKARMIGAILQLETARYDAFEPRDREGWNRVAPGTYFEVTCGASRNGYRYGAGQPRHRFKTEAERDAFVARYLKDARARMFKKFGRKDGAP